MKVYILSERLMISFFGMMLHLGGLFCDDCEPELADSCFTEAKLHLERYIAREGNPVTEITNRTVSPQNLRNNRQDTTLEDLCLSLEDALITCTTDIIENDCAEEEGYFQSWIYAVHVSFDYLCGGNKSVIDALVRGSNCWDIDRFINCTGTSIQIQSVQQLFLLDIDKAECRNLMDALTTCNKEATISSNSCDPQLEIQNTVRHILDTFIQGSHCKDRDDGSTSTRLTMETTNIFLALIGVKLLHIFIKIHL